jgi:hypothetical protein
MQKIALLAFRPKRTRGRDASPRFDQDPIDQDPIQHVPGDVRISASGD